MTDYGHDLLFGTFITPTAQQPQQARRAGAAQRAGRARPRDVPGPPLPAGVPRHVDAAVVCRGPHRANPPVRQRRQPAAAAAGRAGPRGGEPRPAQRRPGRARARGRGVLGRDRGDGRRRAWRRGSRSRRSRRPSRSSAPCGTPRPVAGSGSTGKHHRVVGAKRGPAPAHDIPHLGRRAEAADAAAGRPDGRRLAAQPEPPRRPEGIAGRQRRHRRGGAPAAGRDPPRVRRLLNLGPKDADARAS